MRRLSHREMVVDTPALGLGEEKPATEIPLDELEMGLSSHRMDTALFPACPARSFDTREVE
jgi:hypothetical protein